MPSFLHCAPQGKLYLKLACLLSLWNTVSAIKEEAKKEKLMTFLPMAASGNNEVQKEKDVAFLGATELPARSVDLSALNLTELVNSMLARALRDSRKFFSLLSITSYSSFAFHKFSVAIYNISNLKTVDPVKFPTRYCYCLNNRTNDLSDFTALLVDIIGNSTSYLTEIFKSTSILSVSQTNESDCIFICVMTGKSGRNLSDFWEMAEKSPVINYTFTSSTSGVQTTRAAMTSILPPTSWQTLRTSPLRGTPSTRVFSLKASSWPETAPSSAGLQTRLPEHNARTMAPRDTSPPVHPTLATRRVAGTLWVTVNQQPEASTLPVPWATDEKTPGGPPWEASSSKPPGSPVAEEPMSTWVLSGLPARTVASPSSPPQASPTSGTQTPSPTKAPAPKYPHAGDLPAAWPFSPGEEPALVPWPHQVSRCPQPFLKEGAQTAAPPTLAFQKLNPCLMELCRFFQQCLCMAPKRVPGMEAVRYCLDYYSWFLKNATYICQRVKRVSWSYTLKQKCLENICKSV